MLGYFRFFQYFLLTQKHEDEDEDEDEGVPSSFFSFWAPGFFGSTSSCAVVMYLVGNAGVFPLFPISFLDSKKEE